MYSRNTVKSIAQLRIAKENKTGWSGIPNEVQYKVTVTVQCKKFSKVLSLCYNCYIYSYNINMPLKHFIFNIETAYQVNSTAAGDPSSIGNRVFNKCI